MVKPLSECRVLIVDDIKTNIDLLVEALRADYRLSFATSGNGALTAAARTSPDLILLDVMMPDLDGYEVCRRLRSDPATQETPILFLSALDEARSKVAGFEAGGTDYVTKPFDLVEVKARVRSLLRAKSYQDAVREQRVSELRVARQLQMSLVPSQFPRLGAWDCFAVLEPAREVGGDLYQFFSPAPGRLCASVGDVSGKGIPAALFMAVTTTLIRATARLHAEPEALLSWINEELLANNPSNMFVTIACVSAEETTGRLRVASGGHPPPVLVSPGRPPRLLFESLGTALGIVTGARLETASLTLGVGETLLLYTDGVTEAFDPEGRAFSESRLIDYLSRVPVGTAREIVSGLVEAVRGFTRGPQSDDIAILALRYAPTAA